MDREELKKAKILIVERIVAVADVFDALAHDRPYRRAGPLERALAEIRRLSGSHFDPEVVEAFEMLDHQGLIAPVGAPNRRGGPALARVA